MTKTKEIELKVKRFIRDENLFRVGDSLLLAISGGPDSLCLLLLMHRWREKEKWKLKVAYFDHGLRKSSGREAAFVKNWAKKLHIPFIMGKGNVRSFKKRFHLSTEESARMLRYTFLKKEAQLFGIAKIVLAHHLNDQIETFFVNLLKGSGLGGISGMKSATTDEKLRRPLLCLSKKEILDYLKLKKIKFQRDETNTHPSILRNQVRLKLIPFIEKNFRWNILKSLPRMMTVFKSEHEVLEKIATQWSAKHMYPHANGYAMSIDAFLELPPALQRRLIKLVLDQLSSQRNYSSSHIEMCKRLFLNPSSHKQLMLPDGIRAEKFKRKVVWFRYPKV